MTSRCRLILQGRKAFASGAGYIHAPLITADWSDGARRQMILLSAAPLDLRQPGTDAALANYPAPFCENN